MNRLLLRLGGLTPFGPGIMLLLGGVNPPKLSLSCCTCCCTCLVDLPKPRGACFC